MIFLIAIPLVLVDRKTYSFNFETNKKDLS
jgi:hypothetical protein